MAVLKVAIMKQTGPYTWIVVNSLGKEMTSQMYMPHLAAAEDWIQKYVSSWNDWSYKVEPKAGK